MQLPEQYLKINITKHYPKAVRNIKVMTGSHPATYNIQQPVKETPASIKIILVQGHSERAKLVGKTLCACTEAVFFIKFKQILISGLVWKTISRAESQH